jgi:hypothetical protein
VQSFAAGDGLQSAVSSMQRRARADRDGGAGIDSSWSGAHVRSRNKNLKSALIVAAGFDANVAALGSQAGVLEVEKRT